MPVLKTKITVTIPAEEQESDALLEWLKKLGPPSPEAHEWARRVLGL